MQCSWVDVKHQHIYMNWRSALPLSRWQFDLAYFAKSGKMHAGLYRRDLWTWVIPSLSMSICLWAHLPVNISILWFYVWLISSRSSFLFYFVYLPFLGLCSDMRMLKHWMVDTMAWTLYDKFWTCVLQWCYVTVTSGWRSTQVTPQTFANSWSTHHS